MHIPLQITFKGIPHSDALEARIREKVAKLEKMYGRITGCHVTVDAPHRHHSKGKRFRVRLDVTVPGHEIVINRDSDHADGHSDVFIALRDAFNAATRKIEDFARIQRGDVKRHDRKSRHAERLV